MRIGYSYIRYSSDQQADGDSIRRQTTRTKQWCERNGVTLDTSTTYEDRGKSAYHGRHRETGVLAKFLSEVEAGHIPRGSVLIIENLDRLSRENPWDAVPLLCSIVNADISVVTLSPSEMVYQRGRDMTALVLAVIEFGRGHSESASKADRLAAVWGEKKDQARKSGSVMTRALPGWVREQGGKLVLIPERARVVRKIFDLALSGHGLALIVKHLTDGKTPVFGRGKAWSKSYVHKILAGRVAVGEFQPLKGGEPDGDPIPNYFPPAVDETTWQQAQAALSRRRDRPGRVGHFVASLFSCLIKDARTRGTMHITHQAQGRGAKRCHRRVLMPSDASEGRTKIVSFPYTVFEQAVLSCLKEINPADVLGKQPEGEAAALAGELATLEGRMRQLEDELTGEGDVPTLARAVKAMESKRQDLLKRRAEARRKESNPQGEAWGKMQSLLDLAKDDARRLRLRDLLREVVEEVWVLVVARRPVRLAAVQLFFREGGRRDYLIRYTAAGTGREGGMTVHSLARATKSRSLDLRRPDDARGLEEELMALDLADLA
jgi:DNA invertase Pin-like site-specific DNA recombinase